MTCTRSSAFAASIARRISRGILSSIAFRRAGLFSVTRAIRPVTEYLIAVKRMRFLLRARIAIHAQRDLVFRFHFPFRLDRASPPEGAAGEHFDRIPAGALRGHPRPLGPERSRRAADQAP